MRSMSVVSWWQNIWLSVSCLIMGIIGGCLVSATLGGPVAAAAMTTVAWSALWLVLAVRSMRIGAYPVRGGVRVRGLLFTRTVPRGGAVAVRVIPFEYRGTSYVQAIDYDDARGRRRTVIMWWTATYRVRTAYQLAARLMALMPEIRHRPLTSDDVAPPASRRW